MMVKTIILNSPRIGIFCSKFSQRKNQITVESLPRDSSKNVQLRVDAGDPYWPDMATSVFSGRSQRRESVCTEAFEKAT
jgi:hypothetical protein